MDYDYSDDYDEDSPRMGLTGKLFIFILISAIVGTIYWIYTRYPEIQEQLPFLNRSSSNINAASGSDLGLSNSLASTISSASSAKQSLTLQKPAKNSKFKNVVKKIANTAQAKAAEAIQAKTAGALQTTKPADEKNGKKEEKGAEGKAKAEEVPKRKISIPAEESARTKRSRGSIDKAVSEQPINAQFDEAVPLEDLEQVYLEKIQNNSQQFLVEFVKLNDKTMDITNSSAVSERKYNFKKNRYNNVFPYDESRVKLSGGDKRDYINAAFMEGYPGRRKFIATQGPKWNTAGDFWRMIWEYQIETIVMLCNCIEDGREKCFSYWTANLYEHYRIEEGAVTNLGGIVVRPLSVAYDPRFKYMAQFTRPKADLETRQVVIFQYIAWPDHGVPKTTTLVMWLRQLVNDRSVSPEIPVVVHCSAGAGRSGTYIAMDILFDYIEKEEPLNISQLVFGLRECRSEMIQKPEQYQLVYRLAMENYIYPESDFFVNDFVTITADENWLSRIKREFNLLRRHEPFISQLPIFESDSDQPQEHQRWSKSSALPNQATEIEVPYLPLTLVLAPIPEKREKESFWRMVVEKNVNCIISLEDDTKHRDFCAATPKTITLGSINIKVKEVETYAGYMLRYLKVIDNNQFSINVIHVYTNCWGDDVFSPEKEYFDDVIERIKESVGKTINCKILVCCKDGSSKSGTFVAIVDMIERLRVHKRIDVFRTVKDLVGERSDICKTIEVYKHFYDFMKYYAEETFPDGVELPQGRSEFEGYVLDSTEHDFLAIGLPENAHPATSILSFASW